MYQPAAFVQADPAALARLIAEQPLATLVRTDGQGQLVADLIPLQWRPIADAAPDAQLKGHLVGHVARANPLWREADGAAVLAVFQGPQAYISPSWYPSKADTGQVVPTWNYTVAQAHGRLRVIDDVVWLRALVESLTAQHEGHRAQPWHVADAPAGYIDKMLRAIVGIEIAVHRLEGKWKHSQNRGLADRAGVAAGLEAEARAEAQAMAALVKPGGA
ncbi:MAG TPA: FMN-binding negative transcriptional regulator [Ideonella sp.]|jgi:transcriptional regulator|nr:FMN-binding negative transcriptional regulator [Ideonella sp.]